MSILLNRHRHRRNRSVENLSGAHFLVPKDSQKNKNKQAKKTIKQTDDRLVFVAAT